MNQTEEKAERKKIKEDIIKKLDGSYIRYKRTLGQKAADSVTKWAGSWTFILCFFGFLIIWIALNLYGWARHWDPYPFILLNLVLSCIAAIQAPIILMSQNRAAQRDRIKAEFDFRINKKAEKEIREIRNMLKHHFQKK